MSLSRKGDDTHMGKIYEIKDRGFEFYKDGNHTGHYARGLAIDERHNEIKLELLCNGSRVWLPKYILELVCTNHADFGRSKPIKPYIDGWVPSKQ